MISSSLSHFVQDNETQNNLIIFLFWLATSPPIIICSQSFHYFSTYYFFSFILKLEQNNNNKITIGTTISPTYFFNSGRWGKRKSHISFLLKNLNQAPPNKISVSIFCCVTFLTSYSSMNLSQSKLQCSCLISMLKFWFQEDDKARLVQETGLQLKQINNWFINQRKRNWHNNPSSSSALKSKRKR